MAKYKVPKIKTGKAMKKGSQLEIGRLLLNNKPLNVNLSSAITEVTLSQTIEGASTLTLNLNDYKRNLVNSDFSRTATRLKLDGINYRLTHIDKSGDGLTLTFEEEAVYVLRGMVNVGNKSLKRKRKDVTRAQFIRLLAREPALPRGVRLGDDPRDRPSRYVIPFRAPEVNERQPVKR